MEDKQRLLHRPETTIQGQGQGNPQWTQWQDVNTRYDAGADQWHSDTGQIGSERCDHRGHGFPSSQQRFIANEGP